MEMMTFIDSRVARRIDEDLMSNDIGYSLDQLMELAGLAVAQIVHEEYPNSKVLIICGPGNNGGDGLVAGRHLSLFGHTVTIHYPIMGTDPIFKRLLYQCLDAGVTFTEELNSIFLRGKVILDSIFGFSFHGEARSPFKEIIELLCQITPDVDIVSIDVPSGWIVDTNLIDMDAKRINPSVLISLTAPKICAKHYKGKHYLAGRFLSKGLLKKYNITLPSYPSSSLFLRIS